MSSDVWLRDVVILVVGLVGGYLMAVLANMHTPRLVRFLETRKLLKQHKTRQQALVVFNRIKDFHEGKRDRYPFYILLSSGAVLCAIFASMLFLIISIQNHEYPVSIEYAAVAVFAVIATVLSLVLLGALYENARQIERYDDYKAEFEKQWGLIDPKE